MRDEILAKYFIAGQNLEKIKMIEEGCKLLELTGSIIEIAQYVKEIYNTTSAYVSTGKLLLW